MTDAKATACIFCQSQVSTYVSTGDPMSGAAVVKCDVCGDYSLAFRAVAQLDQDRSVCHRLSSVLRERTIKGLPPVLIALEKGSNPNAVTIEELVELYPRDASEMIDRSLMNIANLTDHPCDRVTLNGKESVPILFGKDIMGALRMKDLLESLGYISFAGSTESLEFIVTAEGWERIAELRKSSIDSRQVFVAMWFDEVMDIYFRDGIKPGIESAGDYQALRVDLREHNGKICDQIIAEIRRSRFVVADFTDNRGGVYFEAGFALGLGIPVIWTVEKTFFDKEDVHFDTRQYNHIVYETPEELRVKLNNRIRATIV